MRNKKEVIKTIILTILIISSLIISYLTIIYKPEKNFLKIDTEFKHEEKNKEKTLENSFKLLSPYIIVENNTNKKEEQAVENAITKVKNVKALKDKEQIKEILKIIAGKEVDINRVKNKTIEEIKSNNKNYYLMKYKVDTDTISTQKIYLGENKQNTKINFDSILIPENEKNTIYLYEQGQEGYMQIVYKGEIYDEIEKIFISSEKTYKKYLINATKEFYIPEKLDDLTINEYEIKKEDSKVMFKDIFKIGVALKTTYLMDESKETSDGYVILRETKDKISYINPSNIGNEKNDKESKEEQLQYKAAKFLLTTYNYETYYNIIETSGSSVEYQESYKNSMAFSKEVPSKIKITSTKNGISRFTMPKISKGSLIGKKIPPLYHYENIDLVLNYLYSNININNLYDVEIAYKKTYKEDKIVYSPTWYINYNGIYYTFKELQEKRKKGEI